MKKPVFLFLFFSVNFFASAQSWIRINQIGYLNNSIKNAVLLSKENLSPSSFEIINALTNKVEWIGKSAEGGIKAYGNYAAFKSTFRLDFSEFSKTGTYYVKVNNIKSPSFKISNDVYNGTADFLLNYMRQQQCGYNPFLKDSCHTHDGFIVDYPEKQGEHINAVGGWHDASDYLQYAATSATAVYQMLFAYKMNPGCFKDNFDANGDPGSNNIPDILDQAKWGLDWLVKLNPSYGEVYNQVADDRDHAGFRLPNLDSADYGKGFERPVYFITGKPQGLSKYKNRTTGVSSTSGKLSSAFAFGSEILAEFYPEFSELIKQKAEDAYKFAKTDLGVSQTASFLSPYFYEEDNYIDDLELAAAQLYEISSEEKYLDEAVYWGKLEPFTPWMGSDTARHYQWYPFVNLGHFLIADGKNNNDAETFKLFLKKGTQKVYERGKENPFLIGIPFIWCSNNLVSAIITQCRLYNELTNDTTFLEMEAALRDWIFGCNIWGTSMVIGLPEGGDYPEDTHSSLAVLKHYKINGGLVDGPVYTTIFKRLLGLRLVQPDEYAEFQSDVAVYHDDYGDYSTNEPTMDGTASLTFYLSAMQKMGMKEKENIKK